MNNKLRILLFVALFGYAGNTSAQLFSKNSKYLSAGYGILSNTRVNYSNYTGNLEYSYKTRGTFILKY